MLGGVSAARSGSENLRWREQKVKERVPLGILKQKQKEQQVMNFIHKQHKTNYWRESRRWRQQNKIYQNKLNIGQLLREIAGLRYTIRSNAVL